MSEKININKPEIFFIAILVLTSSAAFFLGKISERYKIGLEKKEEIELIETRTMEDIQLVASSRGEKYHLPWCSGALSMSEENKIFFENKEEAEKAGYTPAKNCEGL